MQHGGCFNLIKKVPRFFQQWVGTYEVFLKLALNSYKNFRGRIKGSRNLSVKMKKKRLVWRLLS
jgi:hypothetical protein